ncbi:MAG TPA: hypothetical protein ENI53_02590 [Thermoplasmatales archaeon]|nr:hypothetical protein [Thermoplasmatales archaeon]
MVYVLDTSAILSGKFFGGNIVTSPKVLNEIKPKGHSWRLLEYMKSIGMKIISPPKKSVKIVRKTAEKTGDIANLSDTDLEVLALAHHLNATLLTDDYSMQNVAKELKIDYMTIVEEGIKKKIEWIYECSSCGKIYEKYLKECIICGGKIKRRSKIKKRRASNKAKHL